MKKIIVAIDGFSACGKSTTAKEVAKILGYKYIDSGAMYRAVTLYFIEQHVVLTDAREVDQALNEIKITFQLNQHGASETFLNGVNAEKSIRTMNVSERVSQVSTIREVRVAMVDQQRQLGINRGIVMDGRDIGSVVFPDAELKLFLVADIKVRALRRQKELLEKGEVISLHAIIENLKNRDRIDSTRKESPLIKPAGALEIDTTLFTIDEQVDEVVLLAISRLVNGLKTFA